MIQFNCPRCRDDLSVADDNAGRHTWCRSCQRVVMVPAVLAQTALPSGMLDERSAPSIPQTDNTDLANMQAETERLRAALEESRTEQDRATQSKQQQMDALQHELESVRAERDELSNDLDDQHARLTKLEQALEQAEQDRTEAEIASSEPVQAAIPDLKDNRAEQWASEKTAINTELSEIRDTLAQRDLEINDLRRTAEDTEALRARVDTLELAARERDNLRSQLHAQNEASENEAAALAALQERIRDTEANNATLTQQLKEAGEFAQNAATAQHAEELDALRTQLDEARNANTLDQSVAAEIQDALAAAEAENNSLLERVHELEQQGIEVDTLRGQLHIAAESNADAKTTIEALQEKLRSTASHVAALSGEVTNHNAQTGELDSLRQKAALLEEIQRDANDLRERLAAATQAGSKEQSVIAELQNKLRESESRIAELDQQVAELNKQNSEIDTLRERASKFDDVQRNAADLQQQLEVVTQQNADDRSAMTSLQDRLKASEAQVSELQSHIAGTTSELDTLREQSAALDQTKSETASLREQLQFANEAGERDRNALTEVQETLQQSEARVAELTQQVAELGNQASDTESLRDQLETAKAARADVESRATELEARVQSIDTERASLAQQSEAKEQRLEQATTDLASRNDDLTKQDSLLAETRLDLDNAREEANQLRASLANQATEAPNAANLESEMQELRAELGQKEDEINSLAAELETERARASAAEAHAAMPNETFSEAEEPPAFQPAETVSHTNATEDQSDDEPKSEEDDMLDALMRFLGRQ